MSVAESNTIDAVAHNNNTLILEIYDHLPFEGMFEFDHSHPHIIRTRFIRNRKPVHCVKAFCNTKVLLQAFSL